jgi:hypothetical protein
VHPTTQTMTSHRKFRTNHQLLEATNV